MYRTVVLAPERLKIELRKAELTGNKVVEIVPGFDGSPEGWLGNFDRMTDPDQALEKYLALECNDERTGAWLLGRDCALLGEAWFPAQIERLATAGEAGRGTFPARQIGD